MATWLAVDQLDFHGAWAVASGWLRRAHRLLDPLEPGPRPRLARLPRGLPRAREGDTRAGARARPAARPSSGGASASRTWRCSGSRSKGATLVACARGGGGDALPRRGDGGGAGGRGDDPDLERLDVLLPRLRVHGRARLRAGVRVVRPDRRVRRALREPLHARLLPRRVRRGAPLARPLGGGRGDAGGGRRGLRPLAPGVVGGAARRAGGAAAAPGRAEEAARCSTGRARPRGRAALPRPAGARPRRGARGRSSCSSGCCARCREERRLDRAPALELLVRARVARGELDEAGAAARARCARSSGWSARHRCGRAPTWPRACSPPPAATTNALAPLLEDAVDALRAQRRAVRGRAGEDRARHEPGRARSRRGGRAGGGRGAASGCSRWARRRRPSGRGGSSALRGRPPARAARASSRRASARCCACSPRG